MIENCRRETGGSFRIPPRAAACYSTGTVKHHTLLHTSSEVRADVDRLLDAYYTDNIRAAQATDPAYGLLWERMSALVSAGGKRLRPYLLVLAYEMYGGTAYREILPVAAAVELLHQSLLVHDDITDKDTIRYGVDNMTGTYLKMYAERCLADGDDRHYAESAALLAGDLLLSGAYSMVLDSDLPAADKVAVQRRMAPAIFAVAGGQLLDMEGGMQEMRLTDPFKIARLKTSSYSFVLPLQCGAGLAGAPESELAALRALGEKLGEAFQAADDILGLFGDQTVTGKSNLTDLQEGKHTLLMQLTFRHATPTQLAEVRRLFGRHDLDEAQAGIIRDIVVSCGARAMVEDLLDQYRADIDVQLDALDVPDAAKRQLHQLVVSLVRRER